MTSTDTLKYTLQGFDNEIYKQKQSAALQDRISKFSKGRLYLEIGGKFLFDAHASRVLPGFDPKIKIEIFKGFNVPFDIIYCVNAQDIKENRYIKSDTTPYADFIDSMITEYESIIKVKPYISINLINPENKEAASAYRTKKESEGYKVINRYFINGYPDANSVVTENGYGADEYLQHLNKLVLVVGPASNSGKMSTCLGQIYHDKLNGEDSGYAKYETFPIWNLPVNHPINIAYEAATVDIGDFNMVDKHHLYAYNISAVNYNRDVAAFIIVREIISRIVDKNNFLATYKSPTDMGVNMAKEAITNDEIVSIASYQEIVRRRDWYYALKGLKPQAQQWGDRCEILLERAKKYIDTYQYDINLKI